MATFTPHTEKGRKELKETYFSAVNQGNLHLVTECLRRGQDPNSILDDSAALHIAAEKGDIGLGYILTADERTNVDIRMPSNRRTPLMLATQNERREFVQFLIKRGADSNCSAHNGYTALHIAVKIKCFGIVYDLVNSGANTRAVNVYQETPTSLAAIDYPSASIVGFLLRKGGLLSQKQVPILIGGSLTATDAMGRTPQDVAEVHRHYELVRLYQKMGQGKRRKVLFKR
ncbi:unnamed protein product [Acanthoscelides obtectus]|uniref:Ankyrin repeat domain-containing protein n=1 Tax=Acanthoscelides obtectus TaxID=200917 RepID=A0A9P0LAF0_ACAOB|nr:unnamed protein product [Acanthoscelides obtectus]CAK1652887.1 Putative ankyrin repeat protein RF_0381 [Acanthoscelides obtectus]